LRAKTSYRRRLELIVERLETERKELDIEIEAELEVAKKLDIAIEVANTAEVAGQLDSQNPEVRDL
jgi:hypothetical protein